MRTIILSSLVALVFVLSSGPVFSAEKPAGNNIPVKAYRHFKKTFAGVSGEQWSVTSNGFMSVFTIDGAVSRVFYNNKGNWLFTIECYGESKLPADARAILKSVYPDYSILTVEEIQKPERIIYQVDITCNKNWKTIRICEGEMELVNDFVNP
jgi:hypothetical protein